MLPATRITAAILLSFVGLGCSRSDIENRFDDIPTPVAVVTISQVTMPRPVVGFGRVHPLRYQIISFQKCGVLQRLIGRKGDRVKAGALLAELNQGDLQSRLREVERKKISAQRQLWRLKSQAQKGKAAPGQVNQARKNVALFEQEITRAKTALREAEIRAPFDGYIVEVFAAPGDSLYPEKPLMLFADLEPRAMVHLNLPPEDFARIRADNGAVIIPSNHPEIPLLGVVLRTARNQELSHLPFFAEILVENYGLVLSLGESVQVRITPATPEKVVLIPQEALVKREGNIGSVLVTDKNGWFAVPRTLDLGPEIGSEIVVDRGLHGGERLIVAGHRGLKEGARISVAETR